MKCRSSKVQNYGCTVMKKQICFDACLAKELFLLWDKGIETTGCCCGKHSNCKPDMSYIGVENKYISKMKKLGYKVRFNSCRPGDEDSFIPKTKFQQEGDIMTIAFFWKGLIIIFVMACILTYFSPNWDGFTGPK